MKKKLIQIQILLCICIFITSAGMAAETEKSKNWEFNLAPLYLWMGNLSGDMTVKGPGGGQPVDLGFSDIWDNLEAIYTIHFEGLHKNNWGFIFNLDHLNLGASGITLLGPIDVDFKETIVGLDLFYRTETGPHTFDYLLGLRYTDVDAEANFTNLSLKGFGKFMEEPLSKFDGLVKSMDS